MVQQVELVGSCRMNGVVVEGWWCSRMRTIEPIVGERGWERIRYIDAVGVVARCCVQCRVEKGVEQSEGMQTRIVQRRVAVEGG